MIAALGLILGAISCSDDDEPKRGNGKFTVNTTMFNHMYNTTSGVVMGMTTTRNKLTLDTVSHKASLELNYNDGNGNQVFKIDDIAVTTKRLGFFELHSPSISSFNGYVDINQGAMRYDYTTPGGIRVISMTPEVFFLKTKTTLTYDDTTKSNTVDNAMYQFNVMPEAGTASIIVMQVVHAKDRKYFNSITAASVPYSVTPDGFTINASNLNTNAYYVLHYTDSLGTTISTTNKYPFKTFNATVNLVDDQFEANYMIGSSATATATGKAYPDYNAY